MLTLYILRKKNIYYFISKKKKHILCIPHFFGCKRSLVLENMAQRKECTALTLPSYIYVTEKLEAL